VRGIDIERARWKPPTGEWSILEIVRHLVDEEIEDFRRRVRLTIETPEQEWPAIDPPKWAVDRKYNQGALEDAVPEFVHERAISTTWLKSLGRDVNWHSTHTHPKFGSIRAGDLLTAWAAHDDLHLRQIAKRLYQLTQRDGGEFSTAYAGEWTA
jgi:hypothetical protein